MYFLGIDGGGTKTEFLIIDESGNIKAYYITSGCHYKYIGFDGFKQIISDGVEKILSETGIGYPQITNTFAGLPGYGENIIDAKIVDTVIADIFLKSKCKCGNDAVAGWAGSLACQPGINIVAGTGTIGIGVDKKYRFARSGGWGHLCGDEGSAYWLGKKLIELFTKESDGRIPKSPLYHILKKELNIACDFDVISLIMDDYKMDRDKIAGLAVYLYKAALEDDQNAIEIFQRAADELLLLVDSIIGSLNFDCMTKILLSYSGGVFRAENFIIKPFRESVLKKHQNIELIRPTLRPVTGAALYALTIEKGMVNKNIIDRLIQEEIRMQLK